MNYFNIFLEWHGSMKHKIPNTPKNIELLTTILEIANGSPSNNLVATIEDMKNSIRFHDYQLYVPFSPSLVNIIAFSEVLEESRFNKICILSNASLVKEIFKNTRFKKVNEFSKDDSPEYFVGTKYNVPACELVIDDGKLTGFGFVHCDRRITLLRSIATLEKYKKEPIISFLINHPDIAKQMSMDFFNVCGISTYQLHLIVGGHKVDYVDSITTDDDEFFKNRKDMVNIIRDNLISNDPKLIIKLLTNLVKEYDDSAINIAVIGYDDNIITRVKQLTNYKHPSEIGGHKSKFSYFKTVQDMSRAGLNAFQLVISPSTIYTPSEKALMENVRSSYSFTPYAIEKEINS